MAIIKGYSIEGLIARVERLTGERFVIVSGGRDMGLRLADEGIDDVELKPTFSARGEMQVIRYLQGMIRAAEAIARRAKA